MPPCAKLVEASALCFFVTSATLPCAAAFNANATHQGRVDNEAEVFKAGYLIKSETGANYLITRVTEDGAQLRGGRYRYMRLALAEIAPEMK